MHWFVSNVAFYPELSLVAQQSIRSGYGILLLGILLFALPHWKRFFRSERWGGYAKSMPSVDLVQNPIASALCCALWFVCATCLIVGKCSVVAAFVNVLLCRYFFVHMRWKGVLRGMGAPGLMTYWTGVLVFLLELTQTYAPDVRPLALLVLQCDFAFIMLSAGIYKFTAGYARNEGMEYGLVNPEWGYWVSLYKELNPSSIVFKTMNQLAWSVEVVTALMMICPPTRFAGGLIMALSFVFIASQIRLTLLCELVILDCFLFCHPGSVIDTALLHAPWVSSAWLSANAVGSSALISVVLSAALWTYLVLLPIAHGGLFYNFYGKKSLPAFLQVCLERYTNFFGLIIWRVFSVDVVNFFIRVYRMESGKQERVLLSKYGWNGSWRFNHVAESITLTSLFTTLKYYSSQPELFNERLNRYAKTLNSSESNTYLFEYMSVQKTGSGFVHVPIANYSVDTRTGIISESILNDSISVKAAHQVSPVREGVKPGSYVALGDS